ncbi:adenylate cyclase type IX, putative [Pediculus humanus corporis]|uniref:Adenylate cyclase type 9 n=1 Tax=Pediculus humanus subsp. corporis TaxID=121224 RepID=E0VFD0_PEDHC|nr:adenylate cyclase type IX, putative [Pediculus humanus corporis]EEB12086.1 adenylate cyclase type IX, putative [Pediculus humanus corporis]
MNELLKTKKNIIDSTKQVKIISSEGESEDEIQMTLAPYIQTYLAHCSSGGGCGCLPVPFERAARHSWILPSFDSNILEKQFKISSFKQFTKRFRFALIYMMIVSGAWLIFLLCQPYLNNLKFEYIIFAQLFIFAIWILFLTYKKMYEKHDCVIGGITALHLVLTSLIFMLAAGGTTMVSHFTMACSVILSIYTIFPLQPYLSLTICLLFSITFECILATSQKQFILFYYGFVIRILCQVCVHIIGFHILVMTHVRVRGTFMKVGQRLLVQKQLEMEKQLKENIIHSVMPPKVANWLLSGEHGENVRPQDDLGSLFRPFNMSRMDNVSILFADIVGFTKMSSNKTAEEIVDILNDLFERFDDLCIANGCEKISTLGDCYYCVSGCPEPRPDHAKCCVEMGLDMIDAIQEFDIDRGEDVNMRVGVHTGTVLCGIVGTRRFKFDVWSNDVSFANKLESTGLPGRVHISEQTAHFLRDFYSLENYEDLQGVKTYLIKCRTSVIRRGVNVVEMTSSKNLNSNRKSVNFGHQFPSKKNHYLSLLTDARSKFVSLPNVLGSNRTLSGSVEKINYSPWLSFSKLRKNSSSANESSSLRLPSLKNMDEITNSRSSLYKEDVFYKNDDKTEEEVSLCPSLNIRNSGIRNGCNNRRSSIQQQIYLLNGISQSEMVAQKIGSYCNSSQSTLSPLDSESDNEYVIRKPVSDNLSSCFYSLRKQSDLQLVKCIKDLSQNSYIVNVPLDELTLFFKDKKTEEEYRANAHKIDEKKCENLTTLSTSRFNTYFDVFVSCTVFACTTVSLYVLHDPSPYFVGASTLAFLIEFVAFFLCLVHLAKTSSRKIDETTKFLSKKIFNVFSKWYPWHVFGGLQVDGDATATTSMTTTTTTTSLINFDDFLSSNENKKLLLNVELRDPYYTILILIGLIHFCNFTQLNFFMKSILALISGIIYVLLYDKINHGNDGENLKSVIFVSQFLRRNFFGNNTFASDDDESGEKISFSCRELKEILNDLSGNVGGGGGSERSDGEFYVTRDGLKFLEILNERKNESFGKDDWMKNIVDGINGAAFAFDYSEIILNVFIVICLVLLLNREFEISYRFSYYCNTESIKDKMRVQNMKNQADWLLENIIPKHVSIELKNRAKYCKNHSNVGIMFASIVNFNKLYDESYSGGKEYLRVLNELISDFDELLSLKKFENVDKIKTIGSTFMGASGLNPNLRKENKTENEHIFQLMDFALEMYRVVDVFNTDLLGFNLILRVGFNVGEVTAGVIGSSKLFYDIWGDAVNVASRMDSCGVDGRIQVPHSCVKILSEKYNLEHRGQIYIKGKGDTLVYLTNNKW